MQQRQPRLGDILDDYCTRERRLTNHVVVAMVGDDVKQTRCTTCDGEHEYKHAKVPRARKKTDTPAALYAQVLAGGPKRVTPEAPVPSRIERAAAVEPVAPPVAPPLAAAPMAPVPEDVEIVADEAIEPDADADDVADVEDDDSQAAMLAAAPRDDGPSHRRLIRATLPKIDGQPPAQRQAPEFTIRQPVGRPVNRFRPRRGPGMPGGPDDRTLFNGNRPNGNGNGNGNGPGGPARGNAQRTGGGRPPDGTSASRFGRRHGHKRSK